MDLFKEIQEYQKEDMKRRHQKLEDAELELAQMDFDITRTMKHRAEQELVVQQLCELATGHDFAGNDGDDTNTCQRCGFETLSYLDHLADMVDEGSKEIYRRGL